jgi:hypothetical protein
MMDALDKLIQKYRLAFHEGRRVAAANRRLDKERRARVAARYDEVYDRVKLNVPLPRHEDHPEWNEKRFKAECVAVEKYRMQMTMAILTHFDEGSDPNDRPDLTF